MIPFLAKDPNMCCLFLPVSAEEKVHHVVVEVLVAAEVLVDQWTDPGSPLREPHLPGV